MPRLHLIDILRRRAEANTPAYRLIAARARARDCIAALAKSPARKKARFEGLCKITKDGCWEWTGAYKLGYGQHRRPAPLFYLDGRNVLAKRAAWLLYRDGEIPQGMTPVSDCGFYCCVRPEHLKLVPIKQTKVGAVGELNGAAKLRDAEVIEIRASTEQTKVLAEAYGVAPSTIREIRAGKRRKLY